VSEKPDDAWPARASRSASAETSSSVVGLIMACPPRDPRGGTLINGIVTFATGPGRPSLGQKRGLETATLAGLPAMLDRVVGAL
jgi:hypothetical protein